MKQQVGRIALGPQVLSAKHERTVVCRYLTALRGYEADLQSVPVGPRREDRWARKALDLLHDRLRDEGIVLYPRRPTRASGHMSHK